MECDSLLAKVEEEVKRVEGWAGRVGEVGREKQECVDIREEQGEEELEHWRTEHRESVRREKEQERKVEVSEGEVWRRLEELEVREALEEQWEEEEDTEEDETDEEETEDEEEDEGLGDLKHIDQSKEEKNRRVSWAFGEGEDPCQPAANPRLDLRFHHSDQEPPLDR